MPSRQTEKPQSISRRSRLNSARVSAATHQQQAEQHRIDAGLRDALDEGAGCLSMLVLTPETSITVVTAATNGDPAARVVLSAADQLLRQIEARHTRHTATPCVMCDAPLWRSAAPHALCVLLPLGIDAPTTALGVAFCAACCSGRCDTDLARVVVEKLRDGPMPDVRLLQVMEQVGHA